MVANLTEKREIKLANINHGKTKKVSIGIVIVFAKKEMIEHSLKKNNEMGISPAPIIHCIRPYFHHHPLTYNLPLMQ